MAQWRRHLTVNPLQRNTVGSSSTPSIYADMAELEDAAGSNPAGEIHAGSNPAVSMSWRFGREVYCTSLENWRSETGPGVRIPQSPLLSRAPMVSGHTANVLVGKPTWGFESLRERYAGMVEFGRRSGSRTRWEKSRVGSSPTTGTYIGGYA